MLSTSDLTKRERDLLRMIRAGCHIASKNYTS